MSVETVSGFRRRAEQLVAHLPPLLVEARQVAAVVAQGVHGRRRVGPGETFWQFRRYAQGDAATMIDWRASARSPRLYVRETEWEAAESVWLWADTSPSMHFASSPELATKHERARLIVMALAVLLVRGGESIALLGVDRRPGTGSAALTRMATRLQRGEADNAPSLPPAATLPSHARLVLVSDFLEPAQPVAARIRHFAGQGVAGHLVRIVDPAEESFPYAGRVRFDGTEREGTILAHRSEALRNDYRERFVTHTEAIALAARNAGWSATVHRTNGSPHAALLPLYIDLGGHAT
ncbi:MAG: DUF58 domain-containing protein [bacterium]|nr:DUF58 domain-containing protein [bacterium]